MSTNRTRALIGKRIFPLWMREKRANQIFAKQNPRRFSTLVLTLAIAFGGAAIPWQKVHAQAVATCVDPGTGPGPRVTALYACYNDAVNGAVGATTSLSLSLARFTLAASMPDNLRTWRSMVLAQLAQVIPMIGRTSTCTLTAGDCV